MRPASSNAFYKWLSPDNDKDNMTWFQTTHYHCSIHSGDFSEGKMSVVQDILKSYEEKKWPLNCVMFKECWDFSLPVFDNSILINNWNKKWEYPKVINATMTMFFEDGTSQLKPDNTFVFDKDAPNSWVDEHYADTNISYQSHINTTINFSAAFGTTPSDGSVATMVIPDAPFSYTCNRTIYGAGNLSDSLSYSGGLVDHNGSLTAGLDSNYKYFSSPKCLGYTTDPSGLAKKVLENMDKPTFPLTGGTVPISGTYTEGSGTDVFTYSGSFTLTPVQ